MLISKPMERIIRVLLNKKNIKLREISKEANVSLGVTVKNTNALEKSKYMEKKVNINVINQSKLLKSWVYISRLPLVFD